MMRCVFNVPRTPNAVRSLFVVLMALACCVLGRAAVLPAKVSGPAFLKRTLTDQYFCDGITAGDINRDGKLDIVAGPFWYPGPDFKEKHEFYPAKVFPREPAPTASMFSCVHGFNGGGWPDILVLGRVHLRQAFWYEN